MRPRKIVLALFACLALGAFAANAAQAAQWTVGTTENQTTAGTTLLSEKVSCRKHGTSTLLFTTTLLGEPVEISAEGVDCLEKAGSANPAIINTVAGVAHSEGVLTFTGVKVLKPTANCHVQNFNPATGSGEITTVPVTDEVIMDPTVGSTVVFDKFFPETVGGAFVTLEFSGANCPLAEASALVKGSFCGEVVHTIAEGKYASNVTGTLTKVQTLLFGAAQQSTAGCALTFGTKAAQIAGAVDNELVSGKPFGAD